MVILVESRTKWKLEVRSLVLGKDSGVWRTKDIVRGVGGWTAGTRGRYWYREIIRCGWFEQ